MNVNLLSLAQDALGGNFSKLAGQFLGESPNATQSALTSLLPAVLGGIAQKGATPGGAAGLMSLINGANLDTSTLGNVAGLFGGGGSAMNDMLKLGTSSLVPALFGDKGGALVSALSSMSGIKSSSATSLLAMVVPLALTFVKKLIGDRGLDAGSLSSLLGSQGPNLQAALDPRITSALGYANPAAFVGKLGGAGAAVSTAAAAATATAPGSGLMRWLPWVIGAAVLAFLWNMFGNKPAPAPAPAPAVTAPAPVAKPAPVAAALPAKVYFDIGSAAVGADGSKTIAGVADLIKRENAKVSITGYTDKTGDAASNAELAKKRAGGVKDALLAAGVAETSVEMKPPLFVEVGAGGSDADARRVEIVKQ